MMLFAWLLACGEKESNTEDTGAEDTAVESTDTGTEETGESTEGNEGTGETGESGTSDNTWTSNTIFDLVSGGGCGDYFLYAHNTDDTLSLQISGSGLAMEAHQSERGVVEHIYSINPMTDDIQPLIVAQEGVYLNEWSCNDVVMNEPRIDVQYVAVSGTVHVTVVAEGEMTDWGEAPANITLEITDVCFEAPEPFCIEAFSITEYIGWMPG